MANFKSQRVSEVNRVFLEFPVFLVYNKFPQDPNSTDELKQS